jgi:hypothetical protein
MSYLIYEMRSYLKMGNSTKITGQFNDISLPDGWEWTPTIRVYDHEDCMGRRDPVSHVACRRIRDNEHRLCFCDISEESERRGALLVANKAFQEELFYQESLPGGLPTC